MREKTLKGEKRAQELSNATEKPRKIRSQNCPLDLVIWKSLMTLESCFPAGWKPDFNRLKKEWKVRK